MFYEFVNSGVEFSLVFIPLLVFYENINVSRIFRVIAVAMFSLKIIFWKLARRPKLSPLRMPDV